MRCRGLDFSRPQFNFYFEFGQSQFGNISDRHSRIAAAEQFGPFPIQKIPVYFLGSPYIDFNNMFGRQFLGVEEGLDILERKADLFVQAIGNIAVKIRSSARIDSWMPHSNTAFCKGINTSCILLT